MKALRRAGASWSAFFTFDTPKLEPSAVGFTKQGMPRRASISSSVYLFSSPRCSKMLSATFTPKARM